MPYGEPEAARVVRQVLNALVYMHGRGIVHRDLYVSSLFLFGGPLALLAGPFLFCTDSTS
jgi:serine/threonine protein kinase